MTLNSRATFAFPSEADLNARYVRRFVGGVLAADTYLGDNSAGLGQEVVLANPNGPVMGRMPSDTLSSLLEANDGGRFLNRLKVYRFGGIPQFRLIQAGGTAQAPVATANGQNLGTFAWSGYSGSAELNGIELQGVTREAFSPTTAGSYFAVRAVDVGTATLKSIIFVQGGGVGVGEISMRQGDSRIVPTAAFRVRNPANTGNVIDSGNDDLSFFNVPRVSRQLVPLGSSSDTIINALNNLGLFRLV